MKFMQVTHWIAARLGEFLGLAPSKTVTPNVNAPALSANHSMFDLTTVSNHNVVTLHRKPPVRIIRESEPGAPVGAAGRMVMSGRFADVCDELNRLAA